MSEGWSTDITTKSKEHYYINGISLCEKVSLKFYMKIYSNGKGSKWSNQCAICCKKQKET